METCVRQLMTQARTIQIFLPDGNPRGVRLAEITSRTVQVLLVPRAQLDQATARLELSNVWVYFLVGDNADGLNAQVYVGEAEDCCARLKQQHKQRIFGLSRWWPYQRRNTLRRAR